MQDLRAESSGVQLRGVGIGERPERLLVLALVGMAGFLEYALAAVCILAGVTFVHHAVCVLTLSVSLVCQSVWHMIYSTILKLAVMQCMLPASAALLLAYALQDSDER